MQVYNPKHELRKRKINKFIKDNKIILTIIFCVLFFVAYLEFKEYQDNKDYEEILKIYYGLDNKKPTKEIMNAPFIARSIKVQDNYDKCINEKDYFYCKILADYEKSQGHIKNYLMFLEKSCEFNYEQCYKYADKILHYYKNKNLAKSKAISVLTNACDLGDNDSCSMKLELENL